MHIQLSTISRFPWSRVPQNECHWSWIRRIACGKSSTSNSFLKTEKDKWNSWLWYSHFSPVVSHHQVVEYVGEMKAECGSDLLVWSFLGVTDLVNLSQGEFVRDGVVFVTVVLSQVDEKVVVVRTDGVKLSLPSFDCSTYHKCHYCFIKKYLYLAAMKITV